MRSILVVDDEANLRHTIAYALRKEGYLVLTADDGDAAPPEIEQPAVDVASQLLYDVKTLSVQSQVLAAGLAVYLANWLLAGYKDQRSRVRALHLDGDASDQTGSPTDMWVVIGNAEISNRIHVEKSRPGSMGLSRDFWIEGITHDIQIDQGGHKVAWQLGDVLAYGPMPWILDSSGLDSTAILGAY